MGALNGFAKQSCDNPGDAYNRPASKGIDGVNAGVDSFTSASDLDHMFVTCHQDNAWWEVQLHTRAVMTSIYIYNRIDSPYGYGWDSRLKDVYLEVYDGNTRVYQEDLAVNDKWDNSLVVTTFDSSIVGNKVRLQKYGLDDDEHNLLNIWEVEVYGRPFESEENMALSGFATQSCDIPGDAYNRPASKGIDGVNAGDDSYPSFSGLDHM